ncbi:MAG: hypothetical protein Q9201_002511 [Fulgogasparrea decipioides]
MNVQRFAQQSARRICLQKPTSLTCTRFPVAPIASAYKPLTQSRPTTSAPAKTVSESAAHPILVAQRRNRPVSPHLSIYQPQIPWILSGLNRITGSILSGGFYIFGFTYLVAPLLGWHVESTALAESFGQLPTAVKAGLKFTVALPFAFHSFNGVRHLVWDSGREFGNRQIVRSGWVVVGLTFVTATGLAVYGT